MMLKIELTEDQKQDIGKQIYEITRSIHPHTSYMAIVQLKIDEEKKVVYGTSGMVMHGKDAIKTYRLLHSYWGRHIEDK